MALKDILVGVDRSTAGEGRLKLALNLARAHQAHVTVCYIMRQEHGPLGPILPGVPVNPNFGFLFQPSPIPRLVTPYPPPFLRSRVKPSTPNRLKSYSGPRCGPTPPADNGCSYRP